MAKKWIAGAIKHKGALTRKAHKAGQSPMAFAHAHAHDKGTTGKQARLAITLRGMHHSPGHLVDGKAAQPHKETEHSRAVAKHIKNHASHGYAKGY